MRAKEEAFRILETALSIASAGVDDVEVCLGGGDIGVTHFADNHIHPAAEQTEEIITIRVSTRGMMGRVETSDLSAQGIKEAAQLAKSRVELLPKSDESVGLPEPQTYDPVEAYDPDTEVIRGLDRMGLVGRALIAAHRHNLTASGFVAIRRGSIDLENQVGIYAVANTRGLLAYHPETRATFNVAMTSQRRTCGWAQDEAFSVNALDIDRMVDVAVGKACVGGEPKQIAPGSYTAILEPAATGELVKFIGLTAGASLMAAGGSFLSGRLGEKITNEAITIIDDHAHPLHRNAPFDIEGVAKKRVAIINNGVAEAPVYSWDSAVRLDAEPTGHRLNDPFLGEGEGATSLVLDGGTANIEDLLADTKSGVLVTRLAASRLLSTRDLMVTGVARDGVFLVEKGEVVAPLTNMRFTVNVLDVLNNIEAMTVARWAGGSVAPAVKVKCFPFISGSAF